MAYFFPCNMSQVLYSSHYSIKPPFSFWLFHIQETLTALFSPAPYFSHFWLVCTKHHDKKLYSSHYLDYIFIRFKPGHGWLKLKHINYPFFPTSMYLTPWVFSWLSIPQPLIFPSFKSLRLTPMSSTLFCKYPLIPGEFHR